MPSSILTVLFDLTPVANFPSGPVGENLDISCVQRESSDTPQLMDMVTLPSGYYRLRLANGVHRTHRRINDPGLKWLVQTDKTHPLIAMGVTQSNPAAIFGAPVKILPPPVYDQSLYMYSPAYADKTSSSGVVPKMDFHAATGDLLQITSQKGVKEGVWPELMFIDTNGVTLRTVRSNVTAYLLAKPFELPGVPRASWGKKFALVGIEVFGKIYVFVLPANMLVIDVSAVSPGSQASPVWPVNYWQRMMDLAWTNLREGWWAGKSVVPNRRKD